tara:strand:- start:782 stop:1195 length:414 start_codon:yes stop_codon:yes gene_type:complete
MTFRTDYIADTKGRVYEIDELNKNRVGFFIQEQYHILQMVRTRLDKLHDRLFTLRNEGSKSHPRTDTDYKLIKELKLKKYLASEEGSRMLSKTFKLESVLKTSFRTNTIIKTALKAVEEEADYEYVAAILRQGELDD